MKFTLNVVLTVVLFCSAALAGDQGNGGNSGCTINCPPPPCTVNCDGSQTGEPGTNRIGAIEAELSIVAVRQYFGISL